MKKQEFFFCPKGYKNQIFIIDNFVSNPLRAREKFDNSSWTTQTSRSGFRFNCAEPSQADIFRSLDEIDRILKLSVTQICNNSLYVYETFEDEKVTRLNSWIHFDPWKWVGIHYLNLPAECSGGTNFYTHKATGINYYNEERVDKNPKIATKLIESGTKDKDWHCDLKVEMKWNRFILFNPGFIHAPAFYFGKNIHDARKYQVFLFK